MVAVKPLSESGIPWPLSLEIMSQAEGAGRGEGEPKSVLGAASSRPLVEP